MNRYIVIIVLISISMFSINAATSFTDEADNNVDVSNEHKIGSSSVNSDLKKLSHVSILQRKRQRAINERRERRKERRRNRSRMINKQKDEENHLVHFDISNEGDSLVAEHDNVLSNKYSPASIVRLRAESSSNLDWLARNLSSIWQMLTIMHDDIQQIKRYHRLEESNQKKNNRKTYQENRKNSADNEEVEKEDCDPQYYQAQVTCKDKNDTICGGNGKCICGQCECKEFFYGYQCQCNDNSCDSFNGKMCGGPDRGQCRCGACVCRPRFTGNACECSTETSSCSSNNGELCSSHGNCNCNRCYCQDGFSGSICQDSTYSAKICEGMKLCVLCLVFGKSYPQCADCNLNVDIVDEIEPSRYSCVMIHSNCLLQYSYSLPHNADGSTDVSVQRSKNC